MKLVIKKLRYDARSTNHQDWLFLLKHEFRIFFLLPHTQHFERIIGRCGIAKRSQFVPQ